MAEENSWLAAFNYARAVQQKNIDFTKWLTMNDPNKSAFAYAEQFLSEFGFGPELAGRLQKYMEDHGVTDPNQLKLWIYQQPEFDKRFPAIKQLQDGSKNVITPADYIAYENKFAELAKRSGLDWLYNSTEGRGKDLVTKLLVEGVSPDELASRIQDGYLKVKGATPEVRDAMRQYFGVKGDAALAAYFLDPGATEDILLKQAEMAGIAGNWAQAGLQAYSENEDGTDAMPKWLADKLVRNGITAEQSLQMIGQAASLAPIYDETIGEGQDHLGGHRRSDESGGVYTPDVKPGQDPAMAGRATPHPKPGQGPKTFYPGQVTDPVVGPVGDIRYNDITAEMGVEAVAGINTEAMDRIQKRLNERKAAMAGGGGANLDEAGVNLGSAD